MLSTRSTPLHVPGPVFWILAAIAAVGTLAPRLPAQNTASAAAIVFGVGTGLTVMFGQTGISIDRSLPFSAALPQDRLFWSFPLFWVAAVFSCRGAARQLSGAWARSRNSGLWTLTLGSLLIAALTVSENALVVSHAAPAPSSAASAPTNAMLPSLVIFLGWTFAGIITLILIAPWLINKHPGREAPDVKSPVIWLLLNLHFVIGLFLQQSWFTAGIDLFLTLIFVVRVARVPGQQEHTNADYGSRLR